MNATINYNNLATELNTTAKRVETILNTLFGDFEATQEQVTPHVKAVLELMKSKGLTVPDACNTYRLEVQKQQQQQTAKSTAKGDKPGKGSLNHLLESDRAATLKLTQKRYTALIKESNGLLADWLQNGLPEGELGEDLENAIFDSSDDVLDALTSVIDVTGTYQHPQALKPSGNSIAHLLLPSAASPTTSTSNGNGNGKK
ncbi:hypothetical protein NG799_27715 [Laspinema sp. D1]|uniref:Uncharacterized protein n=1 Tax=Laspinema palackyanum D2a TaxID=2953684 RepID=A0ABT2MZB5_9CYAN|nr:hypothetical protein [Laspinema sp. D2a]